MTLKKFRTAAAAAALCVGASAQLSGPSNSAPCSVLPNAALPPGSVSTVALLTVGDSVGGYRMVGIPDGMGAFLNGAGATVLSDAPYVLHYATFAGGTSYRLASGTTPWRPFQSTLLTGHRAFAALFRAGEDEATVERIFPRPPGHSTAAGAWIDGIVVVRTLLWCSFARSDQGALTSDASRWAQLHDFYRREVMDPSYVPRSRFLLEGPGSALISRTVHASVPLVAADHRRTR